MGALGSETGLLAFIGVAGCALPLALGRKRQLPRWLLPLATGAMVGLCAFGLLPEVVEEGGHLAALITAGVALAYCVLHLSKLFRHTHDDLTDGDHDRHDSDVDGQSASSHRPSSVAPLFASIFVHSLFDGGLLVISSTLLSHAVTAVVVSLAIHKAFEALSLASIVMARASDLKKAALWLGAYTTSFPLGVMLALWIKNAVAEATVERFAAVVMAVAIGNLLACLLFDFVMPTLAQVKTSRKEVAWLAAGIVAAAAVLKSL